MTHANVPVYIDAFGDSHTPRSLLRDALIDQRDALDAILDDEMPETFGDNILSNVENALEFFPDDDATFDPSVANALFAACVACVESFATQSARADEFAAFIDHYFGYDNSDDTKGE
jgi:hypothetical protein